MHVRMNRLPLRVRNEQAMNLHVSRKPTTIVKVEAQLCKQTDSGLCAWMNNRTLSMGRMNPQGENGVVGGVWLWVRD